MNVQIPDHIAAIRSYQPGKTIPQLQEEYGWEKVAILWNNENTLGYSPKSKKAVIDAYESINYYPDPVSRDLKEALAKKYGKKPEQIFVGNGSESVLMQTLRAVCTGEDEFLTSEGGFVIIYNWAKINNVRCVAMPMTSTYEFDLEAIKSRINRNTKVIYLANVNNPTGTMITQAELDSFMQHVPDHILVIIDEAYFEYSEALHPDFPDSLKMNYPNILTLRTFSKAYGIAGVRLGFGVGDEKIIDALNKVKLTFEPTAMAQAAGMGALNDTAFLKKTIDNNTKQLKYFYKEFDRLGIKYVRSYANFIMTVWKDKEEVMQIFEKLMQRGVLVRPLYDPISHCIRISVGKPEENQHCVEALGEVLS
ncbi:histidinol-phosphate transaminase [Ekhidna sp. To15]|uniref:histidinol-phosphate transaminase n=1 Tax=Ekhidna sp. To15 TaxID=3395267 RepID=UPI003F51B752